MRMSADARKKQILDAALMLTHRTGASGFSRNAVAREAGCSPAIINYHFGTIGEFRSAFCEHATNVGRRDLLVLS